MATSKKTTEEKKNLEKADQIVEKNEKISVFKKAGDGIKKAKNKVVDTMRRHPVATLVTGAVAGSVGTVATAATVNHFVKKHAEKQLLEDGGSTDEVDLLDTSSDLNVDVPDINVDI